MENHHLSACVLITVTTQPRQLCLWDSNPKASLASSITLPTLEGLNLPACLCT